MRLACQLRPQRDLSFFRIFPPQTSISLMRAGVPARNGQERYLVSMFVDMRGSTKLAETRLPFDTVFIINRFLAAVSQAVVASGGEPNQFVGDGQLALFGLKSDPATACRQAIMAAGRIAAEHRRAERVLARRPEGAAALRHRHSRRRGDHRRHRLARAHRVHRARRSGQRHRAAAGHDEGATIAR